MATKYSVSKNAVNCGFGIIGCMGGCTVLLEESISFSHHFTKNGERNRSLYSPEFIVSENKIDPTVLVALTAHHTPTLMLRNGTSVFWYYLLTIVCCFEYI